MAPDWASKYSPQAKIVGSRATTTNANGKVLSGSGNIEIIANATDEIKGGLTVGVRGMEFSATGKLVGKTIPTVRPINFSGQFVFDPEQSAGTQTYQALTLSDLVRVTYENDYVSPSNPSSESGTTTFFHILSNSDGANSTVESNDRFRYWRSKVIQGSAWNNLTAADAPNNAKGAFPDDYYKITVTARDAAGYATPKDQWVLLDNWAQVLTATTDPNQSGPPQGADPRGRYVLFSGEQWTAGSNVPISLVKATIKAGGLNVGDTISSKGIPLGFAKTDADGKFNLVRLWVPYWDNGGESALEFVADYHNGDDIYQPQLDAVTVLQVVEARMAPARFVAVGGLPGPDGQKTDTPVIVVTAAESPQLSAPVTAADLAPVPVTATPPAVSALPATAAVDDLNVGLLPDLARLP